MADNLNNPQRQGTGFVNVRNLMQANRGNALGQRLLGSAQQRTGGLQQQTQAAGEQFKQDTEKSFQPFQGGVDFGKSTIDTAGNNPTSTQDLKRFQTITGGQYSGPMGMNEKSQQNLQAGATSLRNQAELSKTAGGRESLLSQNFQQPTYNPGQRRLDNLLLSSTPDQAQKLGQLRQVATQGARQTEGAMTNAEQEALNRQNVAKQTGQQVTQQLGTATTDYQNQLNTALGQAQEAESKLRPQLEQTLTNLRSGQISQADADALGITDTFKQFGNRIFDLDPTAYLKQNLSDMPTSVAQIVNNQQVARTNALSKLAGGNDIYDKTGDYKQSSQTFDVNKFKTDVQDKADTAAYYEQVINRLHNERIKFPVGSDKWKEVSTSMDGWIKKLGAMGAANAYGARNREIQFI